MIHVFLGSKSDLDLVKASMRPIFNQLCQDLDIGPGYVRYHICSAHRNSDELAAFVKGIIVDRQTEPQIAIGIAGMAAALPGALAGTSKMQIPVIGVPLDEDGVDSCNYMPPGVPVLMAGVGKQGLKNAALAAIQIEAMRSEPIAGWLREYMAINTPPAQFDIDINAD